jgi:hypothetical protein
MVEDEVYLKNIQAMQPPIKNCNCSTVLMQLKTKQCSRILFVASNLTNVATKLAYISKTEISSNMK